MITMTLVGLDRHRLACSDCDYVERIDGSTNAIAAYLDHDCHAITPDGWCAVHSTASGPAYCSADQRWATQ